MYRTKNNKGYVALITCIILSAMALMTAVISSKLLLTEAINIADEADKAKSEASAASCYQFALINVAFESSYHVTVPQQRKTDEGSCAVVQVASSNGHTLVQVKGQSGSSFTSLQASLKLSQAQNAPFTIPMPQEVQKF